MRCPGVLSSQTMTSILLNLMSGINISRSKRTFSTCFWGLLLRWTNFYIIMSSVSSRWFSLNDRAVPIFDSNVVWSNLLQARNLVLRENSTLYGTFFLIIFWIRLNDSCPMVTLRFSSTKLFFLMYFVCNSYTISKLSLHRGILTNLFK